MERVMGIEPTQPAWKAGILPLNYTRRLSVAEKAEFSATNDIIASKDANVKSFLLYFFV